MTARTVVSTREVAPDMADRRTLDGLIDAVIAIGSDLEEALEAGHDDDDHVLPDVFVRATLADGRAIVAVRLEREPDILNFHPVLLTEEDL